jgi:predicted permease
VPHIPGLRRVFRFPAPSAAQAAAEVDEEIAFHLDERARALEAAGVPAGAARAQARREFGDVDAARRTLAAGARTAARRGRALLWLADAVHDLGLAARGLRRAPVFAAVAALTLALGVGANAAMFGIVDQLLLRPTPGVADPGRVVRVYGRNGWTAPTRSYPDYLDLRERARTFAAVAAYQPADVTARAPVRAELRAERVTATYLPLLGVRPRLGRGFTADEARGPGARVAVVSDRLWRRLFAADPAALGGVVVVGRDAYRVVGVAPPAFRGADAAAPADLWVPLGELPRDRGDYGAVHVVARLRPGVTAADADRDANRANRLGQAADGVRADEDKMRLGPLAVTRGPAAPREVRVAVWLAALAGFVLLIAAANVAHLLLARGLAREGEAAVRTALGASRGRLVRQWLAEGALVGGAGGAAALALVAAAGPAIARLALPGAAALAADAPAPALLDARTAAALAALAAVAGLACGAVPGLHAARRDPGRALRGDARDPSRRRARLGGALLGTQVALTAALLVGAGLFARSLGEVRGLDLGVDVDRVLVVRAAGDGGLGTAAADTLHRRLAERVRAVSGVAVAGTAHTVPFVSAWRTRFYVPGRDPERWGNEGGGRFNFLSTFVDPEYARVVGLRLLGGRWLAGADRAAAEPVAVVNDVLARAVWPGGAADAVGRCIRLMTPDAPCTRVVGVVRAARAEGVFEDPPPQYYLALDQPRRGEGAAAVLVRVAGPPAELADRVRRALEPLAPAGSRSRCGRWPRRSTRCDAPGSSAPACSAPSARSRSSSRPPGSTAWSRCWWRSARARSPSVAPSERPAAPWRARWAGACGRWSRAGSGPGSRSAPPDRTRRPGSSTAWGRSTRPPIWAPRRCSRRSRSPRAPPRCGAPRASTR